ncbi:uncharacterized protein LOC111585092 isoform X2 [Amphiprion ocellaris]|uniref:uncharacterized protein LOC111585092 isoform X2 n=1 Tax=Amphiprion ocellaris TaxID=80972 RepID=UPI0024110AC1|nr:uncharacterized protein LOC111585092 isoform X2 [Amphiprion ocellaris]
MPKKYAYPPETLQILESLWTQGMQNCSTDENKLKIQQASVATGLVDERIKSWIYSRNRKKKRDDEGQSKAKKSCSTASNARISTEDVTQNQDRTEEADSECSRQGQEGPSQDSSSSDEYVNRTTETDPSVQDSDKDSQQGAAASLIQVVEGKVQELHACNCDVIVLVYNHSSRCLSTTGTLKGLDFLSSQNPGIDLQFAAAVSVSSCDYALT